MKNIIQGQKHWEDFKIEGRVGIISTIFTEQYLLKSYNLHVIKHENFSEDIELNGVETVFIDNDIFETDHPWYKKNRGHLINYLKRNNKTICVVQNTTKPIANIFKQAYILQINPESNEYINHGYILEAPLLVDEHIHNPISSKQKEDITYMNIGTSSVKKTHNLNFNITTTNITKNHLSREVFKILFDKLRTSKVLYINNSKLIDEVTLKYIEYISYLYSTYVIFDYKNNFSTFYFDLYSQSTTDNLIYTLLANKQYQLKKTIGRQRTTLLNNTMIIKNNFSEFIEQNHSKKQPYISVITPTNRRENLHAYLEQMKLQQNVILDIIVVTHGFKIDSDEMKAIENTYPYNIKFIYKETEISLGECLNAAIDETRYSVIAKIDDDDYYYKNYLIDQWLALQYSKAELVGKSSSFYYFEDDNLFVLRRIDNHSRYCDHIMGATIMSPAKVMRNLKFEDLPRAVDSDYIKRLINSGGEIYATHPFEMCVFRAQNQSRHTWAVEDMSLYRNARVMGYGKPDSFVEVN